MNVPKEMSSAIQELYDVVDRELLWLHTIWGINLQLFFGNEENFELMNGSAPAFFQIVEKLLHDEIIVCVGRLTDPSRTSGQNNASIEGLIEIIRQEGHTELATWSRAELEKFRASHRIFREWRNRAQDHLDLNTALKPNQYPLPGIDRQEVQASIDELSAIMVHIKLQLTGIQVLRYVGIGSLNGDANALLRILSEASSVQTKRKA